MRKATRQHATTIIVASIVAALTAAAPSIAAGVRATFASNADKVDGIHATTSATATKRLADRRGKLVATSPKTGLLPAVVIPTVGNSDRLGGRTAQDFLGSGAGVVTATHLAAGAVSTAQLADGAVTGAKLASDTVTGADVDEATLGQVPDAARLGGFPLPQIGTTKVIKLSSTPLATPLLQVVDVDVPVDGIVTIVAACEFTNAGAATPVNLFTRRQHPSGIPNVNRNHRALLPSGSPFPNESFVTVTAVDYFPATAGSQFQYGVQAVGTATTSCNNGRLIVTYSATTTEIA